jgi:Fe-Mn family superoxide dismutase
MCSLCQTRLDAFTCETVFEHAYYLRYQNKRNEYLTQLFTLLNWENAAQRFSAAQPTRRLT